jgi:hypothetical protein
MKRIFMLALLALIGVFVTGRITLGEAGAMRFLMNHEQLVDENKPDEACDRVHDDLQFNVIDHSEGSTKELKGGKQEYCSLVKLATTALALVPHSKSTRVSQVKVSRDWMHPWTSHVSYTQDQDITIRGANVTVKTTSDARITMVQTLSGVKLHKLDGEVWAAE